MPVDLDQYNKFGGADLGPVPNTFLRGSLCSLCVVPARKARGKAGHDSCRQSLVSTVSFVVRMMQVESSRGRLDLYFSMQLSTFAASIHFIETARECCTALAQVSA